MRGLILLPSVAWFASWLLFAALAAAPCQGQELHAFFVDRLWTGIDEQVAIDQGVLLVADGKVVAAGPQSDVDIPAGAERHQLGAVTLIPGFPIAADAALASRPSPRSSAAPRPCCTR